MTRTRIFVRDDGENDGTGLDWAGLHQRAKSMITAQASEKQTKNLSRAITV